MGEQATRGTLYIHLKDALVAIQIGGFARVKRIRLKRRQKNRPRVATNGRVGRRRCKICRRPILTEGTILHAGRRTDGRMKWHAWHCIPETE